MANSLLEKYARPSLKRYRWSASPATGLVGLQENAFLNDFFRSAGFMPLATQSGIRETIIKIMLSSSPQQPAARQGYCEEEKEKLDATSFGSELDCKSGVIGRHLPVDPASCTFWCSVAMGALVKGCPVDSVATYVRRARDAVASFSGPANPEIAKAWLSLAYLHGFMDEQDEFHDYLDIAREFACNRVDTKASDALPMGFAELVRTGETIKIFEEDDSEKRKSLIAQQRSLPKLGKLAGEGEICRCVWQSARIFEQAIAAGVFLPRASAADNEDMGDGQLRDADDDAPGSDFIYDNSLGICPVSYPPRCAELRTDGGTSETVDMMAELLQFRELEEVAEIPSISDGIGGLIINDHLLFENVAKGDVPGALERVRRCIEVFQRYPGLCRFKLGSHKAHIMVGILVAMDSPRSRQLYEKLRVVYNLTRPAGVLQIPPLQEWRGVSAFCSNPTCRSAETCGRMAFASSLKRIAVIGEDDPDGADSNGDRQELDESPVPAQTAATSPFTVVAALSGVEPATISLCGSDVSRSVGNEPFFCEPVAQGADAFLFSTDDLGDESEKEAVAAEDWLEVTHAMMDSG